LTNLSLAIVTRTFSILLALCRAETLTILPLSHRFEHAPTMLAHPNLAESRISSKVVPQPLQQVVVGDSKESVMQVVIDTICMEENQ